MSTDNTQSTQRFYLIEYGDNTGASASGPHTKARARILAEGTRKKVVTLAQLETMRARGAGVSK